MLYELLITVSLITKKYMKCCFINDINDIYSVDLGFETVKQATFARHNTSFLSDETEITVQQ